MREYREEKEERRNKRKKEKVGIKIRVRKYICKEYYSIPHKKTAG
jgi:hypothetical protein